MQTKKYFVYLAIPITIAGKLRIGRVLSYKNSSSCSSSDTEVLTQNSTILWSALYNSYFDEINFDPIDLLLAKMRFNSSFNCSSNLGCLNMDLNHNWINNTRQYYSNTNIEEASSFIQRPNHDKSNETENKNLITDKIDYQTLNENQLTIFKSKSPIFVLALTGVTAFNINRTTIHSILSIPIPTSTHLDMNKKQLKQLQNRSLNIPVAKVHAVYYINSKKAKNTDSDIAKGLEAELLLAKDIHIMLIANLWTEAKLVNSSMGTIQDI
ncbi:4050_t:CDS:2, partial [Scutellospora calospora]